MERFYNSQRESVLLGLDNSISNSNNLQIRRTESTNLSTPRRNSDVDFNDVFGGPPRHSLSGLQESNGEEGERGWCAWPPEREKPVFGDDNNGNRRRYSSKSNNNFFDDIFGGEESRSVCSTPKKRDVDAFASVVLSPARTEPVGSSSSLPASFSLPAKLTKGVDLPTFGSPTRRRNPLINDGIASSNGLGSSDSHLSRFSTQAVQSKELQNDLKPSYRQNLLSHEFSDLSTSDKADKGSNMKQDISISEVSPSNTNDQFHFSIYKWASKGVPLAMPHRTSRIKDKVILKRCSSAKDWMASEITTRNPIAYNDSSLTENRKQDVSTTSTTTQNEAGLHEIVEQIVYAKAQSDTLSSPQIVSGDVPGNSISYDTRAESSTHSLGEIGSEKTEAASKTLKLESKPLHSLFKQSDATVNPKKGEANTELFQDVEHSKATSQGSSSLDKNMGKGRVKGKVKEFVQIFNQEAIIKPRVDSKSRLQGSTYSQRGALRAKNEVEVDPEQSKENSATDTTNISATNFCRQDDISASAIPDMSFSVIGDTDGSFHGNFMIQVLDQDEGEVLHNQEIQVIDNKIRHWSKGKEGNIRSLLSTLQHVLWPECGWKPVPLVDIIEGNAVKRAYQKALLYLHPDKLQQKGAASHQKYIAEKVFDILQEAWTQFNMLGHSNFS